tara:strand:+ start:108 stop:734 length:627 start_codon:yes stop_codon:yes gene_type:complete
MALQEFRDTMSFGRTGPWGRIINSFIFVNHPDAVKWQRAFRQEAMMNRPEICPVRFEPFDGLVDEVYGDNERCVGTRTKTVFRNNYDNGASSPVYVEFHFCQICYEPASVCIDRHTEQDLQDGYRIGHFRIKPYPNRYAKVGVDACSGCGLIVQTHACRDCYKTIKKTIYEDEDEVFIQCPCGAKTSLYHWVDDDLDDLDYFDWIDDE